MVEEDRYIEEAKEWNEDRENRIEESYKEYVETFREVYKNNPSHYASPESFRKHMPLTKENFIWIKGANNKDWGEPFMTREHWDSLRVKYDTPSPTEYRRGRSNPLDYNIKVGSRLGVKAFYLDNGKVCWQPTTPD
jgi:hypothetical protein